MNEAAFKLGQLLAVADVVHVGYCMDVRGGHVPPTLLGNSVLAVAQADPTRALALLCRRWKPYAAWAKKPAAWDNGEALKKTNVSGGIAVQKAVSHARRADELALSLHDLLPSIADDMFRAELLLGYLTGLPAKGKGETRPDGATGGTDNG